MGALILQLTDAGLAAIQAAAGTDQVVISEMGLSNVPFDASPTLTALPGEFKRLGTLAGEEVAPNIAHLTAYDTSAETWSATGLGLFIDDGTLFATYSATAPIISKASPSFALVACDVAFEADLGTSIAFGQPIFTVPPATTEARGIVKLSTEDEAAAGIDPLSALSPATAQVLFRALLPVGFMGLWFGDPNTIPMGWAICDGRTVARSDGNGDITTPNFTDRTIIGAGGLYPLGASVGQKDKTVNTVAAGAHTPTGKLYAGQLTGDAVTGTTIAAPVDNSTAQGGTGARVTSAALNDPGHHHPLGQLPVAMDQVAAHEHQVTIDTTQPSLAAFIIMRV